jgi:hypothetical protein
VFIHNGRDIRGLCRRALFAAALAAGALPLLAGAASAQGLFDTLFGAFRRPAVAQATSQDPSATPGALSDPSAGTGRSVVYCVRLCDGRYFPIQRHSAASPAQLCGALCPAARTKIFYGGDDIARTAGAGGERYTDLANAFVYRKRVVADCTCNGKDAFGLAHIDLANDPTLQPGDMVAIPRGVVAAVSLARPRRAAAQANEVAPMRGQAALPRDRLVTGSVN